MDFLLKLKQYRPSQYTLYILFLLLMILPCVALAMTEPLSLWVKMASVLLPLSLYMLLLNLFGKPGYIFVFLFFLQLINGYQLVLLYLFNEAVVSPDMFLTIVTSDSGESGELMGLIWPVVLLACVVYFSATVFAVISIFSKAKLSKRWRIKSCEISGCTALLGIILLFVNSSKGLSFSLNHDIYPVNAVYNLYFAGDKYVKTLHHTDNNRNFRFLAQRTPNQMLTDNPQREVYVLMIGETSRAANWQLYGYNKPTNPNLSQRNDIIVFTDALTEANITHKIVPMILSFASADNFEDIYSSKSIVTAFKEAGFSTAFISNQIPDKAFVDNFMNEADTVIRLYSREDAKLHPQDIQAVEHIDELLDSTDDSMFIVFHSYGSHFEYSQRFEDEDIYFQPYTASSFRIKNRPVLENAYDNSLRHTDRVISGIINSLESRNIVSSMLYLSDHGEDLMDDERNMFLHCAPVPTYYQLHIPFIMWFSPQYITINPAIVNNAYNNNTKTASSKAVFHTMLDIGMISTPYQDPGYSLVNSEFVPFERFFIDEHDEPASYLDLGMKERDLRMMRERGIQVW